MEIESLKQLQLVPQDLLQQRIETVKALFEDQHEMYEIVKDQETGDHYLHYAYLHLNISEGGTEEIFHQLMPLESDDVLSLMFSEAPYRYPEHWKNKFLRNGPSGFYVWFDPSSTNEFERNQQISNELQVKLADFKKQTQFDQQSVEKLLKEMDELFDDEK